MNDHMFPSTMYDTNNQGRIWICRVGANWSRPKCRKDVFAVAVEIAVLHQKMICKENIDS